MNEMNIIKRDGTEVEFDKNKIVIAIQKANQEVMPAHQLPSETIEEISKKIEEKLQEATHIYGVEDIQNLVELMIIEQNAGYVAQKYITYRYQRALIRKANTTDNSILSLIEQTNEAIKEENANKNAIINSTQRDYMAGEVSKDITKRLLLPQHIVKAHEEGIIHFHDADYFAQHMYNCCLVNLEDMLQNGTVITDTLIEKPKSFYTACNVSTQIIAQIASNQYGGQTITLSHLAPFVDISRKKYLKEVEKEFKKTNVQATKEQIEEIAELRVRDEIKRGVQTIQYQVLTLMTTNGQAPFITVYMYLDEVRDKRTQQDLALIIEEMLNQRIQGIKNETGAYITPAFPKLIYVLDENNITPDAPYYYLTKLAAKCSAKRMVPDYISAKIMKQLKGENFPCMGCRSFLTPDRFHQEYGNLSDAKNYNPEKHKYYGRFNQGVVTLNLVDVACSSKGDISQFWTLLDERLELCHEALRKRHERLLNTPSDVAPILWQHGAIARLKKGETINRLLYHGYSTISLGYAGLYEMCMYMTGVSHTNEEKGKPFAIAVMKRLNEACEKWKAEEDIDYSLYGTPMESTTYKFAKCLQNRFGIIKDVTDHNYITNSYHVNVREPIDAFTKLTFESEFQALSPGGAISYVELPNTQVNLDVIMDLLTHIYYNIMYAELNTKSDYCKICGFSGEIQLVKNEKNKIIWKCPNCGNTDHTQMNTTRRICGYLGVNDANQGRLAEISDRVLHL